MFDWIGDAIDWIGDGISSLWDNTIGGVTDAIGDWIWEAMFEWLFNLIYGAIADLFEFINETTSDIFAMSWVQAFIRCSTALLGCFLPRTCSGGVRYGDSLRIWAGKHKKYLSERAERLHGGESGNGRAAAIILVLRRHAGYFYP